LNFIAASALIVLVKIFPTLNFAAKIIKINMGKTKDRKQFVQQEEEEEEE